MNKKKIILGIGLGLMLVLVSGLALARDYELICHEKGEVMEFSNCNSAMDDWVCGSKDGLCRYCTYTGSKGFPCPTRINKCNAKGLTCSSGPQDLTPPEINISSPENGFIYDSKKIWFIGESNESVTWEWKDNTYTKREKWKKVCNKKRECEKTVRFKEGKNDITIRGSDLDGNPTTQERVFTVDSKKPKIKKLEVDNLGKIEIQFQEDNPVAMVFKFGNEILGYGFVPLNLSECVLSRGKYSCEYQIDYEVYLALMAGYDGQRIEYWVELTDIAGTVAESKHYNHDVDITLPVIVNENSFWEQGAGKDAKYIYFDIEIDELNFDEVGYRYVDSRGREKYKKLCSRLKENRCVVKKSFRDGDTLIDVWVWDEAGNSAPYDIDLFFDI